MNFILLVKIITVGMMITIMILSVILVLEEIKRKGNKSNSSTKVEYLYAICLMVLGMVFICLGISSDDYFINFSGLIFLIVGGLHLRVIKKS